MASYEEDTLSGYGRGLTSGYDANAIARPSPHNRRSQPAEYQSEQVSLPMADGGKDAWLFLAGSFCIEALTWGGYRRLQETVNYTESWGKSMFMPISSNIRVAVAGMV